MREIEINSPKFGKYMVQVDDDDYDDLIKYKWSLQKDTNTFYAKRGCKETNWKTSMKIHRHILKISDPLIKVDHIDGNGLNNQKSNLRICTISENGRNRMINVPSKDKCSSKYKGVCFAKFFKKWKADIQVNKKVYHLGYYEKELDAAKAYNEAALKYFGEFACINITEENDK